MPQGCYSLSALLCALDKGEQVKYLWFWGHQPSASGEITASCFSQWWQGSPFTCDGVVYATAEHWMMAGKARLFGDEATLGKILHAATPGEAKKLGRQVTGFDEALWQSACFDLVCEGNYHKFAQHPALKTFLLNTRSRVLVEASPVDKIWGIGLAKDHPDAGTPSRWKGQNLLGFALMAVRDRLTSE
ncbi:NADAR family protein [Superficieibacter sp. 1612_C1]|uniref:NADAR family protein n=1 Tax=Superficieibacter sp. 1612_C1 TaxID=2780382 RepID=UPI001883AC16|nr:NADAR family protein [Superficieibacter sp. 1612_C1]